jgi:uncharacterized protein (DUF1778 family)
MRAPGKRFPPLSFRCSKREAALLAEAAQAQGVSRGHLIRTAALVAALEALGEHSAGT